MPIVCDRQRIYVDYVPMPILRLYTFSNRSDTGRGSSLLSTLPNKITITSGSYSATDTRSRLDTPSVLPSTAKSVLLFPYRVSMPKTLRGNNYTVSGTNIDLRAHCVSRWQWRQRCGVQEYSRESGTRSDRIPTVVVFRLENRVSETHIVYRRQVAVRPREN